MKELGSLSDRYLVATLFFRHRDSLREQPFTSEEDRWLELVASILVSVGPGSEPEARAALHLMTALGLASASEWSSGQTDDRERIVRCILRDRGYTEGQAAKAIDLIRAVASGISRQWHGKIQRYLRDNAERMLRELPDAFPVDESLEALLKQSFTYWLQSALGLPVLLSSPIAEQYAHDESTSLDALVDAADALDLNVSLLDDAIAREVATLEDPSR